MRKQRRGKHEGGRMKAEGGTGRFTGAASHQWHAAQTCAVSEAFILMNNLGADRSARRKGAIGGGRRPASRRPKDEGGLRKDELAKRGSRRVGWRVACASWSRAGVVIVAARGGGSRTTRGVGQAAVSSGHDVGDLPPGAHSVSQALRAKCAARKRYAQ
jgi:hypothetical protein